MGQLVGDHVQRTGEPFEDHAVAVAEDHLVVAPEGVVVRLSVVDGADQRHPAAIDRVPTVHGTEVVAGGAEPVVGLGDGVVGGRRLALAADHDPRQRSAVLGVVDGAGTGRPARGGGTGAGRGLPETLGT